VRNYVHPMSDLTITLYKSCVKMVMEAVKYIYIQRIILAIR